jgi:lipoprotein-releasing system permease protein
MNLPYEWHIGWRYTRAGRAGRRNGFISFISGVSMLGIALGVAALIIVLSVMNGFQKEVRDRMLSVIAHIEVLDAGGNALPDWRATAAAAQRDPRVHRRRALHAAQAWWAAATSCAAPWCAASTPAEEAKVTELARTQRRCWPRCSPANGTSCWAWNWRACWARAWATRSPSSRPAGRSRRRAWCRA